VCSFIEDGHTQNAPPQRGNEQSTKEDRYVWDSMGQMHDKLETIEGHKAYYRRNGVVDVVNIEHEDVESRR